MAPNFLEDDQQKRLQQTGQPAPYNPSSAITSGAMPLSADSGGAPQQPGPQPPPPVPQNSMGGLSGGMTAQQAPSQYQAPTPGMGAPSGNAQQAAGGMQSALGKPNLPSPSAIGGMQPQQPQQPNQQRPMGRRYYGEQKQF